MGIELWRKDVNISNKYVLFCIYRVPTGLTPDLLLFIDKFTELLERFQNRKAYFCCDTNINLLVIVNKTHCNTFYENIMQSGYLPQITLPTRLGSNTLIDNIFTNNIQRSHPNCILQHKLSDHQAMICILKNRTPMKRGDRHIEIETINLRTLENLRNDLSLGTIYTKLDTNEHSDPNHNCEIFLIILTKCKNKHMLRNSINEKIKEKVG